MILTIRPITTWPGELRTDRQRIRSPFSSSYSDTLDLLDRELRMLRAKVTVVQLAVNEGQIRRDGKLYANARPDHPGVILSFDTKQGHFRYAADRFTNWQDNLRAIALGLEALRKIERYGIGAGTEQYTGFLQLEASNGESMTYDEALRFVAIAAGRDAGYVRTNWKYEATRMQLHRAAARALHPDSPTGDVSSFQRLAAAERILDDGER